MAKYPLQPADTEFIGKLRNVLPVEAFPKYTNAFFEDPRGRVQGQGTVVAPGNVQEVSQVIRSANEGRVGVIPYGGGTGLVGGQLTQNGPVPLIISLHRMAHIGPVNPLENSVEVQAGAILADVQHAATVEDRLMPLSLASEGSARIGGLLATNAGGVNVLRYGMARQQVLGLEAVMPNGKIWNGLTRLHKDNTGYDLKNLLIGSEGTLGVITAAVLKLSARSVDQATAVMVVPNPKAALKVLGHTREMVGDAISSFELISGQGLQFLRQALPHVRLPFVETPDWMVLIELGTSGGMNPRSVLENIFEVTAQENLVLDGVVAQSQSQSDALWAMREAIPHANKAIGALASHDVSLPLSEIPDFIEKMTEALTNTADVRVNCFGHLGDGNLHFNVFPGQGQTKQELSARYPNLASNITSLVHDQVHRYGGSISAEHGIGRWKVDDLERYGNPVKLDVMRAIKLVLDPIGIMNPGAVLRAS